MSHQVILIVGDTARDTVRYVSGVPIKVEFKRVGLHTGERFKRLD